MKKLSKLLFSITALVVSAFAVSGNAHSSNLHSFEETPTNEASRGLAVKLAQIDTEEEVSVSKTSVQPGYDAEGNHYLRFVTAFKGDVKGLQYVRTCKDLGEDQQTATKTVTTVYKGVVANGETQYYNGTDFDTNPDTEYYLACYQIKIKAESYETYKHHRWEVSLQVDTDGDITTIEHATDSRTGILEKITPEITFNNTAAGAMYSTDLDWLHNVPSDVEYVVTYDCGDLEIVGATAPENNQKGWSQIIDTVENDVYKAAHYWSPWFYYKGETNVEIRGFEAEDVGESVYAASDRNNAMDGNSETYLWVKYPQREDAYIEWTLDEPVNLNNIKVLLGKDSSGADAFWSTLSVSKDKKTYTTIGNVDDAEKLFDTKDLDLSEIKYIKLTNNNCVGSWAAVREVIINASVEEEVKVINNVTYGGFAGIYEGEIANLYDNDSNTFVRFTKPADETPTRYIQFELTNATDLYAIELLNGDSSFGDLIDGYIEVSSNGEDFEKFGNNFSQEKVIAVTGDAKAVKFIKVISSTNDTYKALREIRINEDVESVFSNVTYGDFSGYQEGSLSNLYDKNAESYVRFIKPASEDTDRHIKFELVRPMTIYAIKLLNGDNVLGDKIQGKVLVSSDDLSYEQFGNSFDKQDIVDLEDYATNVKYIKITSEHFDSWTALREITINETTNNGVVKSVTNGSVYGDNKSSYSLDGDENTYAWYQPVASPSVFAIEYDFFEVQDINSIMILMGNNDSPNDVLVNKTFYYSIDGENYTKINEEAETDMSMDYLFRFETIQARYIKVESDRPEGHSNWIVIREFQVGMDLKFNPTITFDVANGSELVSGSQVTYTINDGLEHSVYFENENGEQLDYNNGFVPSEPGYYSLVIDVPGNDKYNSAHVWATYLVVAAEAE